MSPKALLIFLLFLGLIVAAWIGFAARHSTYAPFSPTNTAISTSTAHTQATSSTGIMNVGGTLLVSEPAPNTIAQSPLKVTGQAKGSWYFEGQFPVQLLDAQGGLVAESHATATGDWMTESFVPFEATITFTTPTTTTTGLLILRNDNPSGDPERDIIFAIPVTFSR
jgi:hypothetical protein